MLYLLFCMGNIELKQFESAISFINEYEEQCKKNIQDILVLAGDFSEIYNKEKNNLPYHINLIDELHANENAYSRIFAKILGYNKDNKFPILEEFFQDVCHFNLSVENVKIKNVDSCGRIDIPIFDDKYVVIIENKVTDKAADQNGEKGGQLARYIETIRDKYGKDQEEIYVIYTPKYTRETCPECWESKDGTSYKESFKNRFRSLSYRDCIYPWFKNKILPRINKTNNVYLNSAVEQYVDHLEGLFSLRTINKNMNMNLQKFIKEQFKLPENNPEKALEILTEKENDFNNVISQISILKEELQKSIVINIFEGWKKQLEYDFPNLDIVCDNFEIDVNCINLGVKFKIDDHEFAALVECNNVVTHNLYFGIGRHFVSETMHKTSENLQNIIIDCGLDQPSDQWWYSWKYTKIDKAYAELNGLIKCIESQMGK